ncbi:fimbrial protein [Entomohabitans teleogrylli]|uniref:fimbrial protein n=1 Tax=Entomohabitans teleogrylli TaxID=1384589 RepID=UPI00073D1EAD|nr:fimbrial protein [Entomohabitans teleogrylli]
MKTKIVSAFLLAVGVGSVASIANAADGTINFTGTITDETCTIASGSQNLNVDLGRVAKSALDGGAGKKAGPTRFTLQLTGCPATVTGASVKFDGVAKPENRNLLELTGAGTAGVATQVGIEIADRNGATIPLYTASSNYPLAAGDNNLDFVARYVSTNTTVGVGTANSTSQFTINYR